MPDSRLLYMLPNVAAACAMVVVAVLAWHRRQQRGAPALVGVALGAGWWALMEGLSFGGFSPAVILLLWKSEYLGICAAPLAITLFAIIYSGRGYWLRPPVVAAMALVPLITLVGAWTNEYHHLIWERLWVDYSTPFPTLANVHGPLYIFFIAYSYSIMALGIVLMALEMRSLQGSQRHQMSLALMSVLLPMGASALFVVGLSPVRNMDPTPTVFNIGAALLAWACLREHLLDLLPVARHEIFRSLEDPIFVLDQEGRIVSANPAAGHLCAAEPDALVGLPLAARIPASRPVVPMGPASTTEILLPEGGHWEVRGSPLEDGAGRPFGRVLVWREITARKRMEAQLAQLAYTDALTGVPNRRAWEQILSQEIIKARTYDHRLSILMVDADHFKAVNDEYGHGVGDRVLIALVAAMRRGLRMGDLLARLGGEEFALMLPETDGATAHQIGQRLLDEVRRLRLPGLERLRCTVSLGVASLSPEDRDGDALLQRADQALYRAKQAGRDQVLS